MDLHRWGGGGALKWDFTVCILLNKIFVKQNTYRNVFIDYKLSWKNHIGSVALKISKTIGLLSKLRHFVPTHTLINIYNSLIAPYLSYGLVAWGQASKNELDKLLILQKCALRFIFFANSVITQFLFF